jgi:hypothetical protein
MLTLYVSLRADLEAGSFLTLDIGGTFLRVVFVILAEGQVTMQQKKYTIDDELKVGEGQVLFGNIHVPWIFIINLQGFQEFVMGSGALTPIFFYATLDFMADCVDSFSKYYCFKSTETSPEIHSFF